MTSDYILASKTEDSIDSFPLVGAATTQDSYDSAPLSSSSSSEEGAKVFLNVYDLNPINFLLSPVGFGLYHSAVQINDCEYSFANKRGIFQIEPRKAKGVRFREQMYIGTIVEGELGEEEVLQRALDAVRDQFQPQTYDLVTRNCNHFCNALLLELLGEPLPAHINRMSYVWTTANIQGLVPKAIRQSAPTGDKKMKAYRGVIPFIESILEVTTLVVQEWIDESISDMVSTSKRLSSLLEDH